MASIAMTPYTVERRGRRHTASPPSSSTAAVSCENVMLPCPDTRMPTVAEYPNTVLSSNRAPASRSPTWSATVAAKASASGRYRRRAPSNEHATANATAPTARKPKYAAALPLRPKCSGPAR